MSAKQLTKIPLSKAIASITHLAKPLTKTSYSPDIRMVQTKDKLTLSLITVDDLVEAHIDLNCIGDTKFDQFVTLDTLNTYLKSTDPKSIEFDTDTHKLFLKFGRKSVTRINTQKASNLTSKRNELKYTREKTIQIDVTKSLHAFNKLLGLIDHDSIPILITKPGDITVYAIAISVDTEIGDSANTIVMSKVGTVGKDDDFIYALSNIPALLAIVKLGALLKYKTVNLEFGDEKAWCIMVYGENKHNIFMSMRLNNADTPKINQTIELALYVYKNSRVEDNIILNVLFKDGLELSKQLEFIKQVNTKNLQFKDAIINFNEGVIEGGSIRDESVTREILNFEIEKQHDSISKNTRFQITQDMLLMIQEGKLVFKICTNDEVRASWVFLEQETTSIFSFVNIIEEISND